MAKPYTVERTHVRTLTVRHTDVQPGWERWHFLGSDVHYDHPDCRRKLFHKHLAQAKDKRAGVFLFGDSICGMQGLADPRSSKDALDVEYSGADYSDRLVYVTADKWREAHDNIELVTFGNHEGAWLKHHERNLVRALAEQLDCEWMGYSGYINFRFEAATGGHRTSRLLYFHHGAGGSAPVTRGTIKTARRNDYEVSPDIVVSGHIHQKTAVHTARNLVSSSGKPYDMERVHLQLGTYSKPDLNREPIAWSDEKEFAPVLLGGYWLIFSYDTDYPGNVAVSYQPAV